MERRAFKLLHDAESSWWYRGRAHVVARVLKKFTNSDEQGGANILDIGAGWGGMLEVLKPYGTVSALEPDADAKAACIKRGYSAVLDAKDISELQSDAYSLIALFDVLEHADDDALALKNIHAALKVGGALILTVPAFMWLWSEHDVLHHHYRRYRKAALVRLLEQNGFSVEYASYWNMLLLIPAAIVRLMGSSGSSSLSLPHMIDGIFFMIVSRESALIPGSSLPFGTGIVLYAKKT